MIALKTAAPIIAAITGSVLGPTMQPISTMGDSISMSFGIQRPGGYRFMGPERTSAFHHATTFSASKRPVRMLGLRAIESCITGCACFADWRILTPISHGVNDEVGTLPAQPIDMEHPMPGNPMNPQPPFAEPGKGLPEREIDNPGHSHPERDVDPEPLQPDRDDDLL